jgi:hypothetical protein
VLLFQLVRLFFKNTTEKKLLKNFTLLLPDKRLRGRFLATLEMTEMGVEMTGGVK